MAEANRVGRSSVSGTGGRETGGVAGRLAVVILVVIALLTVNAGPVTATDTEHLELTKTATPSPVPAGGEITYQLTATNNGPDSLTGVSITDPVPAGTTFVSGSATCGGTLAGGVVTIPVGTLASGASEACSFKVAVAAAPWSTFLLEDGFDAGAGNWTTTHGPGTAVTWGLTTSSPHSPPNAMLAPNVGSVSDQYLTTAAPVTVAADTELRFVHSYITENNFDGGVVEVSADNGTTWIDLGPHMTENGYNATLGTGFENPLEGRQAFSGNSGGYIHTVVDLSGYAGQSVRLRFRFGTDNLVSAPGWRVDDVEIGNPRVVVVNTATVASNEGHSDQASTETLVAEPPAVPGQPQNVVAAPVSATSAEVSFDPPVSDGGSAITGYQAQCVSTDGGATRTAVGSGSPISVNSLSTGFTYRCRVRATNAVGTGAYSSYTRPSFVAAATVPGQPQNVTAAPVSATSAEVSFDPPVSDGGSPITGYQAQCVSTDGGTNRTGLGSGSPISVNNLSTGNTYRCRVRASNAVGTGLYSPYSATFVAQVPATVPGQPQNVTAAPVSATSAQVSFSAPVSDGGSPITGYQAQCVSTDGGTNRAGLGSGSPITVNNLSTGKTYRCRVRATNAVGTSAYSPYSATFIAAATVPGKPQNVTATPTSATSAQVSFSAPVSDGGSPITGYQAQCVSTDGGTNRARLGSGSPITVNNLSTGKTYQCRVRASNAVGTGLYSPYSATFVT